jgi:hypothetical protein
MVAERMRHLATRLALAVSAPALLGLATAAEPAADNEAAPMALVQAGQPRARLVLPAAATPAMRAAAALLTAGVRQSTGATLEISVETDPLDDLVQIHCGNTAYVQSLDLGLNTLDMDGFVIAFPAARRLVLAGGSDPGLEYAVREFLERYVGMRWLFPGPLGEHVPALTDLAVPTQAVREQPAFKHRLFSGLGKTEAAEHRGEQTAWARCNRMHERVQFHHNLWRLFLPETCTATHPEFFPLLDGKRFLPAPAAGKTSAQDEQAQVSWQPCFTAPGSTEAAVRTICEHLAKPPGATSYSLGINDSNRYCTCPTCIAKDGERQNEIGARDVSASYYAWCNAIAAGVKAQHPNAWLGLLAYNGVYSPPRDLRLDDRLVPFITYDRMKWAAPELERQGHQLTEQWAAAAATLGWYDYIYGGQFYLAPRVYMHEMATYLRYGRAHGVQHYYAEAYPAADWHEGPKLYVALKLLWNPDLDVDALLQDWYRAAVGPEAAPHLGRYFAFWEDFWTRRVPETTWFKENGNRQYLDFGSSAYLEALTRDDLKSCAEALQQAVAAAPPGRQQERARFFQDGFSRRQTEMTSLVRLRHPTDVKEVANLVTSHFDADADGWGNWQRDYAKAAFSYAATTGHDQPGALSVNAAGSQATPLCFTRSIPVLPGRTYRAAVWVHAADLPAPASVSVAIKWKDAAGAWVSLATAESSATMPLPEGWSQVNTYVDTGSDGDWAKVHSAVVLLTVDKAPAGQVCFDDFSFDEVQVP